MIAFVVAYLRTMCEAKACQNLPGRNIYSPFGGWTRNGGASFVIAPVISTLRDLFTNTDNAVRLSFFTCRFIVIGQFLLTAGSCVVA